MKSGRRTYRLETMRRSAKQNIYLYIIYTEIRQRLRYGGGVLLTTHFTDTRFYPIPYKLIPLNIEQYNGNTMYNIFAWHIHIWYSPHRIRTQIHIQQAIYSFVYIYMLQYHVLTHL